MNISVAAETIFHIGPFPVTNSFLVTIIITLVLIGLALKVGGNVQKIPGRLQALFELMIDALLGLVEGITGKELGRKIFPLVASLFMFILLSNWSGLIPGFGSIGIYEPKEEETTAQTQIVKQVQAEPAESPVEKTAEHETTGGTEEQVLVPFFRGPTADLNVTLALALISFFFIQYYGFKGLGIKYLGKFFTIKNPINTFIGILEFISELSRIISFSFRLFGNIFAGEVLLTVIITLIPVIAPLPFIAMELFFGFIQAIVFMMLTVVFISMAGAHH